MDKNTVVGKTAKGLREASGKTSLLTRDTRELLKDIDGRLSIGALLRKLPDWTEEEMTEAVTLMLAEDFVRDLTLELPSHEVAQRPAPIVKAASSPPPKAQLVEQGEELDFTAIIAAEQTQRAAEESARRLATEKAEQEAKERAQHEAEAKAKLAAEAQAKAAAEAQARAAAEAQARAAAEAQAKSVAEEQARQKAAAEAQARAAAEQTQRAAEETARRLAAEKAEQEAKEQARHEAEEKAKTDAQDKARHEAEEKARRAAEEEQRRESEERAERAAEALALQHAAEESASLAAEQRTRERIQQEAATASEESAPVVEKNIKIPGNAGKWIKAGAFLLLLALGGGFGLLHVMSFDGEKMKLEKLATAQFGQPVKILSVGMAVLPQPHWRIEGFTVGDDKQISAPRIKLMTTLGGLLGSARSFQSIQIESPQVTEEGLGWLLLGKSAGADLKLGRVTASSLKLDVNGFSLPAVNVSADIGEDGNWRGLSALSADKKFGVEMQPAGNAVDVEVKMATLTLLSAAAPPEVEDVVASGSASRGSFDIKEFKARVAGGNLTGKARLKWGARTVEGDLSAAQIDASQLFAGLMERGRIDGRASFGLAIQAAEKTATAATRLDGDFAVDGGVIAGVDLGRMLQSGGAGGQTQFTKLSGSVSQQGGKTLLRALRLDAGKLSASGNAEVDEGANLRGQLVVELNLGGERRRTSVSASGLFKAPYKNIEWVRR